MNATTDLEAALSVDEALWQRAEWYRALTLSERLPAPPPRTITSDRARSRLTAWRAQKPFERATLFAQRLAADGLCEDELLALLAEEPQDLKARTAEVPDWLSALRDALADAAALPELGELERDHPLADLLPALAPLLQPAVAALEDRVDVLRREFGQAPFTAAVVRRSFVANVAPTLLFQLGKPIVLELHIERLRGRLRGDTPQARFGEFMRRLQRPGGLAALLGRYPVLGRQLMVTVADWADHLDEVLTHLCRDWGAIRASFAGGAEPGALVALDAGLGDRHRRGRSVVRLRFAGGLQVLHKPKPLAVDLHFQELLSWLNERGAQPQLRPLALIDRGRYGWCEHVAATSCVSEAQVTRFYERQGGYLALLYALDAADLHNENVIAAGEHPMPVDLEALFHPHVHGDAPILAGNLAARALDDSVWQVGLLPRRVWADETSAGVEMSGLGGEAGQLNPHPLVGWSGQGGDELRLVRRRAELPASENRPRLHGRDVDVLDYKAAVVAGFERMYRLLCRHRGALLGEWLPRFARDEIRVVVRSTNVYGLLLYESFHPDVLRDALDRDRLFDRLWGEAAHRPHLARLIPAERRDLWRGDIPAFSTTPDSRAIFTSDGEAIAGFFDTPSVDVVRRRVERMGEEDLARQKWIIEASLATLVMGREDAMARPPRRPRPGSTVGPDRLIELAQAVGARLDALALQDDAGASWLGVAPLDESTWGVVPTGSDLYAGTTGIALFLAHLGAVTGDPSHTRLAQRAIKAVRGQVAEWLAAGSDDPAVGAAPTVGALEGLGSVIYVLSHLAVLWRQPELLEEAEQLVAALPPAIESDDRLDVLYGSAGCILALLALHAVRPSPRTLAMAVRCGERLLETAQPLADGLAWTTLAGQPPLGGLSHGSAGIAFSLLELAARSGGERFADAALAALAHDRSLFVPELGNWADLRVFPGREDARAPMVAWCHGAAGIGLGRLGMLRHCDDEAIRDEIDVALATTIGHGFDTNHSLCHGALGNLELLLVAARALGRGDEALGPATTTVARSIEANGPVTGVFGGVETPGFMTGLAGIGYGLLRLAAPDKVPSALLVAPATWPPS